MHEIEKTGNGLISILHGGKVTIPTPFEREIILFDTYIAGTSYVDGMEELYPYIQIGERLNFYREPDNPYDSKAIVIKNLNDVKLGYIPKVDNIIFSRLMDAGKLLFGKVKEKELNGSWVKIKIEIYLKD
ncbi:HIRAN domain-containing protein [Macrococcus capreoli]